MGTPISSPLPRPEIYLNCQHDGVLRTDPNGVSRPRSPSYDSFATAFNANPIGQYRFATTPLHGPVLNIGQPIALHVFGISYEQCGFPRPVNSLEDDPAIQNMMRNELRRQFLIKQRNQFQAESRKQMKLVKTVNRVVAAIPAVGPDTTAGPSEASGSGRKKNKKNGKTSRGRATTAAQLDDELDHYNNSYSGDRSAADIPM